MHYSRIKLHNELHARPSLYFSPPASVFHAAFLVSSNESDPALEEIAGDYQASPHGFSRFGNTEFKWERHGEFVTVTCVMLGARGLDWANPPTRWRKLLDALDHAIINLCQIEIVDDKEQQFDISNYKFIDPAGSKIGKGSGAIWSDFRLTTEGACRFVLVNYSLNPYRLGRMVRRILEIETYRMMSLLALPLAQEVTESLQELEQELIKLSDLASETPHSRTQSLVDDIAKLSSRVARISIYSKTRFSATIAYSDLVFERILELREEHTGQSQRVGVFIERRFRPSVRYCSATSLRLTQMIEGVRNLSELVQARAQVEVEEQNAAILKSLDARAKTQVKIQKAVEGLSIIATTYYLTSLLKLAYQGSDALGISFSPSEAILLSTPIVAGVIWRIRKKTKHL